LGLPLNNVEGLSSHS